VRYTANGGQPAKRWSSAVESIPPWHHRLARVTLLNQDSFAVLSKIDDSRDTAIYVDPPYVVNNVRYVHKFKATDAASADPLVKKYGDHGRLARALERFTKARVVVSYYAHPALAELYPGWRQRTIEVGKALANANRRDEEGSVRAVEVLLVNDRRSSRSELF
jgi:DNA adenine methylase